MGEVGHGGVRSREVRRQLNAIPCQFHAIVSMLRFGHPITASGNLHQYVMLKVRKTERVSCLQIIHYYTNTEISIVQQELQVLAITPDMPPSILAQPGHSSFLLPICSLVLLVTVYEAYTIA